MKKIIIALIIFFSVVFSRGLFAQATNPAGFNLSTGNYTLNAWDSLSAAGTYPPSMIFHFSTKPSASGFDATLPGTMNWNCPYNLTSRNRILGLSSNGFSFLATSSAQFDDCASTLGQDSTMRYVGSALLAMNSVNRENIQVTWLGGTVSVGAGVPPRQFTVRLQYRTDTMSNFMDVPGPVEYISDSIAGNSQTVGPVILPAACNNLAYVQVRWIYYQLNANGGGSRPEMRVDDISITSSVINSTGNLSSEHYSFSVFPNPASEHFTIRTNYPGMKTVRILDRTGRITREFSFSEVHAEINSANLAPGFYVIQLLDLNHAVLASSKIALN
jgi:hypothetical protein